MRLLELLEGRDAPLYHATDLFTALRILEDNKLVGNTSHTIEDNTYNGVSLTRSKNFANSWVYNTHGYPGVIFILDQNKISRTNKIIPIDYFVINPDTPRGLDTRSARRHGKFAEAEEFVVGDINNLSNCLVGIEIENLDKINNVFERNKLLSGENKQELFDKLILNNPKFSGEYRK